MEVTDENDSDFKINANDGNNSGVLFYDLKGVGDGKENKNI